MPAAMPTSSPRCARPRGGAAGRGAADPRRGDAALPADGLQGRVRGGPAAQPAGLAGLLAEHFTGTQRVELNLAPPILAKPRPGDRHAPQDGLRPLDAAGDGHAAAWQGAARHRARPLRPHRGAADGARADRRVPRRDRAAAAAALAPRPMPAICDWAEAAAGIKGYGHIKARNAAAARARMARDRGGGGAPAPLAMAAE